MPLIRSIRSISFRFLAKRKRVVTPSLSQYVLIPIECKQHDSHWKGCKYINMTFITSGMWLNCIYLGKKVIFKGKRFDHVISALQPHWTIYWKWFYTIQGIYKCIFQVKTLTWTFSKMQYIRYFRYVIKSINLLWVKV